MSGSFVDPGNRGSVSDAMPLAGAQATNETGEVSSIGALISDISGDLTTLLRQEVALAKAEATQSATQAGKGAGMLAGAGVAAHFLLLFASLALWWALADAMDSEGWAFVIVALIWGAVAAVLAVVGRNQLKKMTGLERSVDTAKRVPEALKGNEGTR